MGFWGFLVRHPFGAAVSALGMAFTVGGLVSDAYSFYQWGIPPLVWTGVGVFIFMSAILVMLYRFEQRALPATGDGDQPAKPKRRRSAEQEDLETLRKLGYEALDAAGALRNYLGVPYQYGLGGPSEPIPAQINARLGPLAYRFAKIGLEPPSANSLTSDAERAERIMLYCEHAGRIMVTEGLTAEEIRAGVKSIFTHFQ